MELKKNDKVKVKYNEIVTTGTVIGNPYRLFTEKESFVEVYLHEIGMEVPVKLDRIVKLGDF